MKEKTENLQMRKMTEILQSYTWTPNTLLMR